jgi:hypothetical protein
MKLSPIIFFAYNRPKLTLKTLSALKKNKLSKYSKIIFFVDRAKNKKDIRLNNEVIRIIKKEKNFRSKKIILRKKNYGLTKNFIDGMTEIFKKHDRAIILEDDNLVSLNFLEFMNSSLEIYKNDRKVSCIYAYFPKTRYELPETFFLRGSWTLTWGTAFWKRSWELFEPDANKLLKKIRNKKLIKNFNFDNSFDWFSMLERCKNNQNQSWSVRWYASTFLKNTFTLFPKLSLCKNIGMDGSGVNTPKTKIWNVDIYKGKIDVKKQKVVESRLALKAAKFFFYSIEPWHIKIVSYLKKKFFYFKNF